MTSGHPHMEIKVGNWKSFSFQLSDSFENLSAANWAAGAPCRAAIPLGFARSGAATDEIQLDKMFWSYSWWCRHEQEVSTPPLQWFEFLFFFSGLLLLALFEILWVFLLHWADTEQPPRAVLVAEGTTWAVTVAELWFTSGQDQAPGLTPAAPTELNRKIVERRFKNFYFIFSFM